MNDKTLLIYRNLWNNHIKIEQQAEFIRDRLSKKSSFNIYDAFKAVDSDNDGKINKYELKQIIDGNGFYTSD